MTSTPERLVAMVEDEASLSGLAAVLADGILASDHGWLEQFPGPLRAAIAKTEPGPLRGGLSCYLEVVTLVLARLPSRFELEVHRDARAGAFLACLWDGPKMNTAVRALLDASAPAVSRTGRRLVAHGLVSQTRVGREVQWELTGRGRAVWHEIVEARR